MMVLRAVLLTTCVWLLAAGPASPERQGHDIWQRGRQAETDYRLRLARVHRLRELAADSPKQLVRLARLETDLRLTRDMRIEHLRGLLDERSRVAFDREIAVMIPTQHAADAEAVRRITPGNAAVEMDCLVLEIGLTRAPRRE